MKRIMLTFLVIAVITGMGYESAMAEKDEISFTATASSTCSGLISSYGPHKALDKDIDTYWLGEGYEPFWWIMFDAGEVASISDINILWYSSTYCPTDYDIQISDDGIDWENVFTTFLIGSYASDGETREINREARYIRLYINQTNYAAVIREFRAYVNTDTETGAGGDFKIWAETDKKMYNYGDKITLYVYCRNDSDQDILILGQKNQLGDIVNFGSDIVMAWDEFPFDPIGPYSDFRLYWAKGLLEPGRQPSEVQLRIPARSDIVLGYQSFYRYGTGPDLIEVGKNLIRLQIDTITDSNYNQLDKDYLILIPFEVVD